MRSLKYRLGIKFPLFRAALRLFSNRTFIKRSVKGGILFIYINGSDTAVSPACQLLSQRGWTEETSYSFKGLGESFNKKN
jgi:hypothetical protein